VVTNRSYRQQCGIANALDLVGERWAMLVVRDLILGPKRFTDLRTSLPGIATNVLTQRLKQLERDGIIRRRLLPPPAASTVYELTEYGRELEPAVLAFGRWGARTMAERTPGTASRSEWFGVGLKAYFRPEAARGLHATIVMRFDDGRLTVRIDDGELAITPFEADGAADLTLTAVDAGPVAAFLAGRPVAAKELSPDGDRALLRRLPAIFPLRS
jgi:DNA-binding HxlR family transcriptional regulator